MENSELQAIENTQMATITPMQIIAQAVTQGADVDKLEKLLALQERYEANEAKKAFSVALTNFKKAGIVVGKNKAVAFGTTKYRHATLDNVCETIGEELTKHGLSFRWDTASENGKVRVTCVLMHEMGHSEFVSLESSPDTSGAKNSIQAIGSAVTYLQRYTLLAITGTATNDDDDGRGGLTEEGLDALSAQIAKAETPHEVMTAYFAAIETSAKAGDKKATTMLWRVKENRLKTLQGSPQTAQSPAPEEDGSQSPPASIVGDSGRFITVDQQIALGDFLQPLPNGKARILKAIGTKLGRELGNLSEIPADQYPRCLEWIEKAQGSQNA